MAIELKPIKICRRCGTQYPSNNYFRQTNKKYPYRDPVCRYCRDKERTERRRQAAAKAVHQAAEVASTSA